MVAFGDEVVAEVAANTKEQLKLDLAVIKAALPDEALGGTDHRRVV